MATEPQRSDHRNSTLRGRVPARTIIHQHRGGIDLACQADRFQLAGIDIQRVVECRWLLHDNPDGSRLHPLAHRRGRIRLLELGKDGRRNYDPMEKLGKHRLSA